MPSGKPRPLIFVIAAADATEESKRIADRVLMEGETVDSVLRLIVIERDTTRVSVTSLNALEEDMEEAGVSLGGRGES